jgi:hypothetical protein
MAWKRVGVGVGARAKHQSEGKILESAAAFGSTVGNVKIAIGMKQLSPPQFAGLDKGGHN